MNSLVFVDAVPTQYKTLLFVVILAASVAERAR